MPLDSLAVMRTKDMHTPLNWGYQRTEICAKLQRLEVWRPITGLDALNRDFGTVSVA
jgi:hypothetical protein